MVIPTSYTLCQFFSTSSTGTQCENVCNRATPVLAAQKKVVLAAIHGAKRQAIQVMIFSSLSRENLQSQGTPLMTTW